MSTEKTVEVNEMGNQLAVASISLAMAQDILQMAVNELRATGCRPEVLGSIEGARHLVGSVSLRMERLKNGNAREEAEAEKETKGDNPAANETPEEAPVDGAPDRSNPAGETVEEPKRPDSTDDSKSPASDPRIDAIVKSLKPGQSVSIKATAAGVTHKIEDSKK